ncbi:hypothetical protein KY290_013784 [Solanum tuberosum]|uniref:Retrovirus-related Pol polyprotein from transposon TNT 1-94 n=1 Tax=Solanum tuberosum TaxID=4113 RepID=A0ABQ7VMT0_SOLTU|nr:hypothetical protein KY289_013900 [Solanum tuberosum]KAH0769803.1 hypothetical protein KY290_013784 [Solanum tuberosum]
MLMEKFLRSKEFWPVISIGVQEPTTGTASSETQRTELDSLRLKDLKAKNYLFQAIDRSMLETILCKDTSKKIWDSMKKKYQGTMKSKRVKLQELRGEFETLRMQGGESGSLLVHEQKINQPDKDEVVLKVAMSSKGTNQERVKWKGNNWHQKKEKRSTADSQENKDVTSLKLNAIDAIDLDTIDLSVAPI